MMQDHNGLAVFLGILVLSLLLWACQQNKASSADGAFPSKERTMNAEPHTNSIPPAIPPIDMAAPASYETASFGLG